jgi:hypothetical protein
MEYRPWTWKAPEISSEMKNDLPRQDAYERVSGNAVFTRDISLPGMLYGKSFFHPMLMQRF